MFYRFISIVLALFSLHSQYAVSNDSTIRLITFPIPLMVVDENTGLFIELVKEIEKHTQQQFKIEVWPAPRALQKFADNKFDVIFPSLDAMFAEPNQILPSRELLYIKKDFVFTCISRPLIRSIAELKGLTVGLTRSYPYAKTITENKDADLLYVNTDEQNALMLHRKRIDAFVVEESSGLQSFINTGTLDTVHYPANSPISSQDVYFGFQQTKKGYELESLFSEALQALKQSGKFDQIMAEALSTGLDHTSNTSD